MNKSRIGNWIVFSSLCIIILLSACASEQARNDIPVTTSSNEALTLYNEGMEFYNTGKLTEAINKFEQATNLDQNFGMAHLYMGFASAYNNDGATYQTSLDKAVAATGMSELEELFIQFDKADVDGERERQKELLDKIIANYPDTPIIHSLSGLYHSRMNEHDKSIESYKLAIQHAPTFENHFGLGWSYQRNQSYDEALIQFEKLSEMAPQNPVVLNSIGNTLADMGKYTEVIQTYDKLLADNPKNFAAMSAQGDAYILMDKPEMAKTNYSKLFELAKNDDERWTAHNKMATYHSHLNQIDAAYNELTLVSDMFQTPEKEQQLWQSYHYRGDFCIIAGQLDKAKGDYDQWIAMVNESDRPDEVKNVQNSNYYLNMVRIALMNKDNNKAKTVEAEFLKIDMDNLNKTAPYYKIKGLIATAEGHYDDAITALDNLGSGGINGLRKARAHEGKGDIEKAKEYYQGVLDTYNLGYTSFVTVQVKKQAQEGLDNLSKMTAK